ncbi:FAD-dependent thymidylate synthase [Nostocaceae cyanobacterium CENA357]|uniref:FAD-dependent thymidylate synthase n=1 Tax=Atlanticothrix silvestris CENA357 TaxID=1725252 RepID=A0A8J7KYH5_9CYAN|nr:FAD-dependent thymidylate synthase [Atlanticothrix silvestris CENA357]
MQRFRVEVIAKTPNPQQVIYAAMHQDYTDGFVCDERDSWPSESECGEIIVKRLLAGERGHYGPLEHPQIIFNCGYFPHSVMQQARTHRVGVSFDVQCLSGDSEVTFVKTSGSLTKIKISELYDLWTNGQKAVRERKIRGRKGEEPGTYRRDCKTCLRKMKLRVLNEETGIFELGHIKEVFAQGIQPVYRLTLEDGRTLDCTENHRLLTKRGWQTMGEALELITDTKREIITYNPDCYLMTNGVIVGDGIYLEFAQNFVSIVALPQKPKPAGRKLKAHPMKVVQVRYLGMQKTYDLEVDGKWHNFVANGVVVHNSFRYTGNQFIDVVEGKKDIEDVFYLRPVDYYTDRQGKKYYYSPEQRAADLQWCLEAAKKYKADFEFGMSEEHARGKVPFDYRQHFVVSFNLRSFLHFCDLRNKKDAQLEIQKLCELMWPHFEDWAPAIARWYEKQRLGKARLAP